MNVLLPQPDGPITAVIRFAGDLEVDVLDRDVRAVAHGEVLDVEDRLAVRGWASSRSGDVDRPHRRHRNGLAHVLLLAHRIMFLRLRASASRASRLVTSTKTISTSAVAQARSWSVGSGRLGPDEDLHRHVRQRVPRVPLNRVRVDRRDEEQRRRLAGRARDREHRAGHDAAESARQDDAEHRAPAARAERQRAFPLAARHEPEHLLRRAGDERQHHDREGVRRRRGRSGRARTTSRPKTKIADHDRRQAVHQVEHELDRRRAASASANSFVKIAISTPSGTRDQRVAMPTRIAEPTISGAIPPPGWPKSGRSLVRKPIESWAGAALGDRPDHDREHRHRDERRDQRRRPRPGG